MLEKLFYGENLLLLFWTSLVVFFVVFECGFRTGRGQRSRIDETAKSWIAIIDGAVLGIFGIVLAFSFAMAQERFQARKQLVVEEANAIGTTYLRAQWLPEPHRTDVSTLLRRYVDVRLPNDLQSRNVEDVVQEVVVLSEQLHNQLWLHAVEIAKKGSASPVIALFLATLNDMIDLNTKRLAAFQNQVPEIILLLLYGLAAFTLLITGYGCGFSNRRNVLATFPLIGLLALFLFVIVDLDRPGRGLIKVSQQSMIRLQQQLHSNMAAPEAKREHSGGRSH